MGMFDWVICRYPLPEKVRELLLVDPSSYSGWQTKAFNNQLSTIVIESDGRLGEMLSETGEPYDPDNKSPKRFVPKWNFSGIVEFYDLLSCMRGLPFRHAGVEVALTAEFKNGMLTWISCDQTQIDSCHKAMALIDSDGKPLKSEPLPPEQRISLEIYETLGVCLPVVAEQPLPEWYKVLRMLSEAMRRPKPENCGHRGPVGPCGPSSATEPVNYCSGECVRYLESLPDYETAVGFDCETIRRFRKMYNESR